MPMPAKDLWTKIQKELGGRTDREQLRIVKRYLDDWHDSWKGPYADLKKRLLKLAQKLETTVSVRSRDHGTSLHVKCRGVVQVALIGLPNSGKSALAYALTEAPTVIADFPFATQHPVPGMLGCRGGAIQLVDTPPIVPGLSEGEGAGRALLHLIGTMDAVSMVADLSQDPCAQLDTILAELSAGLIEPIPGPLGTVLRPKGRGGIRFTGWEIPRPDQNTVSRILTDAGIDHAEVIIRTEFVENQLRAQVEHRKLIPAIFLANKRDVSGADDRTESIRAAYRPFQILETDFFREAQSDKMAETLPDLLGLVRVYLTEKPTADSKRTPLLVPCASRVEQIADDAGPPREEPSKSARIWGNSVRQPGQIVSLHHLVQADDLIYLQA